jgi:hypothetical protein
MERVKADSGGLESRVGSSIDAERVRETFESLGFSISYYENHTKEQVMDILTKGTLISYNSINIYLLKIHANSKQICFNCYNQREAHVDLL